MAVEGPASYDVAPTARIIRALKCHGWNIWNVHTRSGMHLRVLATCALDARTQVRAMMKRAQICDPVQGVDLAD